MLALRLILVVALLAQVAAAYRCCPSHTGCPGSAERGDYTVCCNVIVTCCSSKSATSCCPTDKNHDEENQGSDCPCCMEHRLSSKQPLEGLPAPENTMFSLFAAPALAPSFQQPDFNTSTFRWERRPHRAQPTNQRLAQLSVWRT